MRTKNEIKQAVAILTRKADRLSLVQAEVLQGSMTEQQVFQKYVMEVAEENRDEEMFFAARDAARFSAGLPVGIEIAVTTAFPTVENGHLTVKLPDRAVYPGFSEGSAYIVEQVAGRKVVAAVEYQVVTGQNRPCVFRSNSLRPTFERGVGREGWLVRQAFRQEQILRHAAGEPGEYAGCGGGDTDSEG